MTAIALMKKQALDPDPKAIQQIIFTGNNRIESKQQSRRNNVFIIEEAKEAILPYYKKLWNHYGFIFV